MSDNADARTSVPRRQEPEDMTRIEETMCPKCRVTLDALAMVTDGAAWVSGICPACGCPIRARRA